MNEPIKTKTCDWCGTEFPTNKYSPKKRFCETKCRVYWNYHNNEAYRQNHITIQVDRYYADREKWIAAQENYNKRQNWEGNIKSKTGKTKWKPLYIDETPVPIDPALLAGGFQFGNIDFGFDFRPFDHPSDDKAGE